MNFLLLLSDGNTILNELIGQGTRVQQVLSRQSCDVLVTEIKNCSFVYIVSFSFLNNMRLRFTVCVTSSSFIMRICSVCLSKSHLLVI